MCWEVRPWCCLETSEHDIKYYPSLLWCLPILGDSCLTTDSARWLGTLAPFADTHHCSFKLLSTILECILISIILFYPTHLPLAEGGLRLQTWVLFCLAFNSLPDYLWDVWSASSVNCRLKEDIMTRRVTSDGTFEHSLRNVLKCASPNGLR